MQLSGLADTMATVTLTITISDRIAFACLAAGVAIYILRVGDDTQVHTVQLVQY